MAKEIINILKLSIIPKSCRERFLDFSNTSAKILSPEGIYYSGISKLKKGYKIGYPGPMESHMIIITQRGKGLLFTKDEEYILTENTVISVPAGSSCMFRTANHEWDILWFYIRPFPKWELLQKKGVFFSQILPPREIEFAMEGYMEETKKYLIRENKNTNAAAEAYATLIITYLNRMLHINAMKHSDFYTEKLEMIWQEIRFNPAHDWNVKKLASNLNLSQSAFQRLVKKHYLMTPRQIIIRLRMEQAKLLLANTKYPVKLIASKLGYSDAFVFANAFRKYSGTYPKFFRIKNQI